MYNHYISQVVADRYVLYLMLLPVNEMCMYVYLYLYVYSIELQYNNWFFCF